MRKAAAQSPSICSINREQDTGVLTNRTRLSSWSGKLLKTRVNNNPETSHAAVPGWLYVDRRLSPADRDVYGAIKLCLFGDVTEVELTEQEIAEFLGCSARSVRRSIAALQAVGALAVKRNSRAINVYSDGKRIQPKVPSVRLMTCVRCSAACKGVNRTGMCKRCVDTEQLRVDLLAVMDALGPQATQDQIVTALHLKRMTAKVSRVLNSLQREREAAKTA